jgi:hypothetical protein
MRRCLLLGKRRLFYILIYSYLPVKVFTDGKHFVACYIVDYECFTCLGVFRYVYLCLGAFRYCLGGVQVFFVIILGNIPV